MGIGTYPDALNNTQRMMSRAQFKENEPDCAACYAGRHRHHRRP
jgi:hypothetical protein